MFSFTKEFSFNSKSKSNAATFLKIVKSTKNIENKSLKLIYLPRPKVSLTILLVDKLLPKGLTIEPNRAH